jgi:hypothetical protein
VSKRANRGYNPKYEQSNYVSFSNLCGQTRKQPEGLKLHVIEKQISTNENGHINSDEELSDDVDSLDASYSFDEKG